MGQEADLSLPSPRHPATSSTTGGRSSFVSSGSGSGFRSSTMGEGSDSGMRALSISFRTSLSGELFPTG